MTVYPAGTRGDAIRVQQSGSEVYSLTPVGTIPGVSVTAAAGRCGPGTGYVRSTDDGTLLRWKEPGSSTWGPKIDVGAGGDFVLEGGDDADAWVRVKVSASYLGDPAMAQVLLADLYNELGPDDVTASEASAGSVETATYTLANASGMSVYSLKVWLDASTAGIEISDDNSTWVSPTTEGTALSLGTVTSGSAATLYVRRTISAGATSDAKVTNVLQLSWEGY